MAVFRLMTELVLGRLHDRQVGGLVALENAADVDAGGRYVVELVRPVGDQAAGRDEFAQSRSRPASLCRAARVMI